MNLNSLRKELDPGNMHDAIAGFPTQLQSLLESHSQWLPVEIPQQISNVLICGMGGSAIGGDLVKTLLGDFLEVPVHVNRSYDIPRWVCKDTLVLISSYSGNTEETVSAFRQAIRQDAMITAVTCDGEVKKLAYAERCSVFEIPGGLQPRAALGYSMTALLMILNRFDLLSDELLNEFAENIPRLQKYSRSLVIDKKDNPAVKLAEKLHDCIPLIYAATGTTEAAAVRFRGQMAENGKMLAFHFCFPEQNHNEIEGWTCNPELMKKFKIVWLMDDGDHAQVTARMDVTRDLLSKQPAEHIRIQTEGDTWFERLLKLIHLTDWISYYTGLLNGVDPTPVDRISSLKKRLRN